MVAQKKPARFLGSLNRPSRTFATKFEVANFSNALTDEACELCAKVDRALTTPVEIARKNYLANIFVKIAAMRPSCNVCTALTLRKYNHPTQAKTLLRSYAKILQINVIQSAISNDQHVVLLVEDYEILQPSFLESISCLICSGEVPGLLTTQLNEFGEWGEKEEK
ncbi:hypothetical protein NECAME_14877 [Necator americanus]|uniref:Dynein heavy chain AAA module D4 domain-containing protein n=1 Tax=Necator americanus TaxID=51031 RepID=W2SNN2_NECAM|nr:hypothetical protein NECAME_14877 [Necator americanus]ETN70302.1 hypothetical protein NECAME_14877 [Necator americanus]